MKYLLILHTTDVTVFIEGIFLDCIKLFKNHMKLIYKISSSNYNES